jgi:membrane protein implicated in regulation of membrane protease activity
VRTSSGTVRSRPDGWGHLTTHLRTAPMPLVLAQAAVHSYTTAFWASTATFALAAVITAALLRPRVPRPGQNQDQEVPA